MSMVVDKEEKLDKKYRHITASAITDILRSSCNESFRKNVFNLLDVSNTDSARRLIQKNLKRSGKIDSESQIWPSIVAHPQRTDTTNEDTIYPVTIEEPSQAHTVLFPSQGSGIQIQTEISKVLQLNNSPSQRSYQSQGSQCLFVPKNKKNIEKPKNFLTLEEHINSARNSQIYYPDVLGYHKSANDTQPDIPKNIFLKTETNFQGKYDDGAGKQNTKEMGNIFLKSKDRVGNKSQHCISDEKKGNMENITGEVLGDHNCTRKKQSENMFLKLSADSNLQFFDSTSPELQRNKTKKFSEFYDDVFGDQTDKNSEQRVLGKQKYENRSLDSSATSFTFNSLNYETVGRERNEISGDHKFEKTKNFKDLYFDLLEEHNSEDVEEMFLTNKHKMFENLYLSSKRGTPKKDQTPEKLSGVLNATSQSYHSTKYNLDVNVSQKKRTELFENVSGKHNNKPQCDFSDKINLYEDFYQDTNNNKEFSELHMDKVLGEQNTEQKESIFLKNKRTFNKLHATAVTGDQNNRLFELGKSPFLKKKRLEVYANKTRGNRVLREDLHGSTVRNKVIDKKESEAYGDKVLQEKARKLQTGFFENKKLEKRVNEKELKNKQGLHLREVPGAHTLKEEESLFLKHGSKCSNELSGEHKTCQYLKNKAYKDIINNDEVSGKYNMWLNKENIFKNSERNWSDISSHTIIESTGPREPARNIFGEMNVSDRKPRLTFEDLMKSKFGNEGTQLLSQSKNNYEDCF